MLAEVTCDCCCKPMTIKSSDIHTDTLFACSQACADELDAA
jgi:hypothetical protein